MSSSAKHIVLRERQPCPYCLSTIDTSHDTGAKIFMRCCSCNAIYHEDCCKQLQHCTKHASNRSVCHGETFETVLITTILPNLKVREREALKFKGVMVNGQLPEIPLQNDSDLQGSENSKTSSILVESQRRTTSWWLRALGCVAGSVVAWQIFELRNLQSSEMIVFFVLIPFLIFLIYQSIEALRQSNVLVRFIVPLSVGIVVFHTITSLLITTYLTRWNSFLDIFFNNLRYLDMGSLLGFLIIIVPIVLFGYINVLWVRMIGTGIVMVIGLMAHGETDINAVMMGVGLGVIPLLPDFVFGKKGLSTSQPSSPKSVSPAVKNSAVFARAFGLCSVQIILLAAVNAISDNALLCPDYDFWSRNCSNPIDPVIFYGVSGIILLFVAYLKSDWIVQKILDNAPNNVLWRNALYGAFVGGLIGLIPIGLFVLLDSFTNANAFNDDRLVIGAIGVIYSAFLGYILAMSAHSGQTRLGHTFIPLIPIGIVVTIAAFVIGALSDYPIPIDHFTIGIGVVTLFTLVYLIPMWLLDWFIHSMG